MTAAALVIFNSYLRNASLLTNCQLVFSAGVGQCKYPRIAMKK